MKLELSPDDICIQEAAHEVISEIICFPVYPRDGYGRLMYQKRPKRNANGELIRQQCNLLPSQTMRNVIIHLNSCMAGGRCKAHHQFAQICAHWKKCARGDCPFRAGGKNGSASSGEKFFQFSEDQHDRDNSGGSTSTSAPNITDSSGQAAQS